MNGLENIVVSCLFLTQAVGLASAAAVRLGNGSPCRFSARCLFFVLLGAVGLCMVVSVNLGPVYWLTSGAAFATMVLTVTCDFGDSRGAVAG